MPDCGSNVVTVFGSNDPLAGEGAYELARHVGGELARLGFVVANGGYGGTMEASARGAKEADGRTIGVTCRIWSSKPNRFIDDVIVADDYYQRVQALVDLGVGGYVALPGGTGTLVELAVAWELMCKGQFADRPLVCVGDFWQPVIDRVSSQRPAHRRFVAIAQTPQNPADHFSPS